MAFCEQCGAKIDPGVRFCEACGAAVDPVDEIASSKEDLSSQVGLKEISHVSRL